MRTQGETVLAILLLVFLVTTSVRGELPDLHGAWAMLQVYPQITTMPLAGDVAQTSYVVQLVDIEQNGESLMMSDQYCFTYVDDGTPLVRTEIPAAFMASLRPLPRTATIGEHDGEMLFVQDPYVEVRGAQLDDVEDDELPVDTEDPRVFDQDGDGHPGMTVLVSIFGIIEGETYIVQRVRYTLSGRVISSDRIEGGIDWSDEKNIIAVSTPLLNADASSVPDPDPSNHRFIMVRAQGEWTCEWLSEHWEELFGVTDIAGEDTLGEV